MMKQRVGIEIAVGIFVVIAAAALAFLAFRVSGMTSFVGGGGYDVTARFDNIGGLKVRAPVNVGGVKIGYVSAISLDPDTFEAVVTIHIDNENSHLPIDTAARILTEGLLGANFIGLSPGGMPDNLKAGDKIETTVSAVILENLISQFLFNAKK